MNWPLVCNSTMNNSVPKTLLLYLRNQNFDVAMKQYTMTPSKQSSAKRCSGVVSTLIWHINTGCLWWTLKTLTNTYSRNLAWEERGVNVYVHINQRRLWTLENDKHLLTVNILITSIAIWRIWRCPLQTLSSCKFEKPCI